METVVKPARQWIGYEIESNLGGRYVGITSNLPQRLRHHWGNNEFRSGWWKRQQGPKRVVSLYIFPDEAPRSEVSNWERSRQHELKEQLSPDMVGGWGNPIDKKQYAEGERTPFNTLMDVEIYKQLKEYCDCTGMKIYFAVECAVRDWLAKHGEVEHG